MTGEIGTEPIVKEVHIDASPETVFAFCTEPEKLTRWLCDEATVAPRPGGVNHQTHPGGAENPNGPYYMRGKFVEVSPPSRVVFTWGFENPDLDVPPGSSTVEVTLEPDNGGTRLRLVHRDLLESELIPHAGGWEHMLARLASAATGGDLREDNMPSTIPDLSSRPLKFTVERRYCGRSPGTPRGRLHNRNSSLSEPATG